MADREDDSLFDDVSAMADRIGLKGQDRSRYIHEHMTRSGYKAVPNYVRDEGEEEEEEEESSGFFGSRRRTNRDRGTDGGRSEQRRRGRNEDDDWYR
jgi:hypothetical protein